MSVWVHCSKCGDFVLHEPDFSNCMIDVETDETLLFTEEFNCEAEVGDYDECGNTIILSHYFNLAHTQVEQGGDL